MKLLFNLMILCVLAAGCTRPVSTLEAEQMLKDGRALSREGQHQKSIDILREARYAFKRAGRLEQSAATDRALGVAWFRKGDPTRAESCLLEALKYYQKVNNERETVAIKKNLAILHNSLKQFDQALDYLEQCSRHYRDLGDMLGVYDTHGLMARMHRLQLMPERQLADLQAALAVAREMGQQKLIVRARFDIGSFYINTEPQQALAIYEDLEPIIEESESPYYVSGLYNNLGILYRVLGETEKAFGALGEAERSCSGDVHLAEIYINMGKTHGVIGEKQKALEYYRKAQTIFDRVDDRRSPLRAAWTMFYIGQLMDETGDRDQARRLLHDALAVFEVHGDSMVRRTTHQALGDHYNTWQEPEIAMDHHLKALDIAVRGRMKNEQAQALSRIGETALILGQTEEALCRLQEALHLQRSIRMVVAEAETLHHMARARLALGDSKIALEDCRNAVSLYRQMGYRHSEALALYTLARSEHALGDIDEARMIMDNAIELLESQRARLESRHMRRNFFASIHDLYSFHIELLMTPTASEKGADVLEALGVGERARARTLLDSLDPVSTPTPTKHSKTHEQQLVALRSRLNGKVEYRRSLLEKSGSAGELATVEKELDELIWHYRELEAESNSGSTDPLKSIRPLSPRQIRNRLPQDTILLQYALGEQNSYLWIVTGRDIDFALLPGREEIRVMVKRVYDLLDERNRVISFETSAERRIRFEEADRQWMQTAADLAKILLPEAVNRTGKRLLIAADDVLHYLPFGALPDPLANDDSGWQPLIVDHEIRYTPSVSVLAALQDMGSVAQRDHFRVALVADPVFGADDPRSNFETGDEVKIPRLAWTGVEAKSIAELVADPLILRGFEARREAVLGDALEDYGILHFATHGRVDSRLPELSGLIFSRYDADGNEINGFLGRSDIMGMKLSANLVVLSACQTALGARVRGEGLVGLTHSFMVAGAPRVVASLWRVRDKATARLMTVFYRRMLVDGERPAEALRRARIDLWKQGEAPYYWAGFVIMGSR